MSMMNDTKVKFAIARLNNVECPMYWVEAGWFTMSIYYDGANEDVFRSAVLSGDRS